MALNGVLWPGDLDQAQAKLSDMDDAKFRRIFGLLYSVNKRLDLFAAFNVDRIFECRILSVDHRYRGRGLARTLLQRSLQAAKDAGFQVKPSLRCLRWRLQPQNTFNETDEACHSFFQLVKEDATGMFSQRAADSMGFQTLHEMSYVDYKNEDGSIAFPTEDPHKSLKIMVKELR